MILQPFSNRCDICGRPRTRGIRHDACAVKRKAMGFAAPQLSEDERIARGKEVARKYRNGTYVMAKEWL